MRAGIGAGTAGGKRGLAIALALLVLGGCVPYYWGPNRYETREAATAAMRADMERVSRSVSEADSRVRGSLLIVAPSRDHMRRRVLAVSPMANEGTITFTIDVLEAGNLVWADVIKGGQVFDQVTVARADDVEAYPDNGYDFKLWLYGPPIGDWQWYLSRPGVKGLKTVTPGKLPPNQQAVAFNESVIEAARALGGLVSRRPASGDGGPLQSIGTGFFIDGTGLAVSNAHVIEGCAAIRAVLDDGSSRPASVIAADTQNDLSLIRVETPVASHARLRSGTPVRLGEPVVIYGYPLAGIVLTARGGLSTGTVSALAGMRDDSRHLQISAPIQGGNSGGPVLDQSGNLIGVVVSSLVGRNVREIPQNVNFAIKTGVVRNFLEAHGADMATAPSTQALTAMDIGDRARAFTFKVECR